MPSKRDPVAKVTPPEDIASDAHRVRLPGFLVDDEVGLGDAIKRATTYLGVPACGGCGRRAESLNRWIVFTGRRR